MGSGSQALTKMIAFLLLAAVGSAMAEPDADPWVYSYGAPLTYLHSPLVTHTAPVLTTKVLTAPVVTRPLVTYHSPLVYTTATGPIITALAAAAPAPAEAPAEEEAERKKRDAEAEPEAEADPEADPWLYYTTHGYWPVGYSHIAPYAHTYGYYGLPYLHYGKRDAEPQPEADPEAIPEADPEADPWVYYSTHGYWPLGYSHIAPHAHTYGYYGLPYLHYGKRDAEPEAEANPAANPEADPWLLYGHHGLLGYGGYYGYGYHHPVAYHLAGCTNYLGAHVPCAGR